MIKPVLFVSFRPLERAENICAIYHAYSGPKAHILSTAPNFVAEVKSGKYNLMVTDDFPYVTPGKCIVIWHAIHGGKKVGLDQPGRPYYNESLADKITYIVSASTCMTDIWSKCTGVPKNRILPLGMPRTDEYVNCQHKPGKKKTYLFVPTFRDKGETQFPDIKWAEIDACLTDDEEFIVKAHPWQEFQEHTDQVTQKIRNGIYKHISVISPAQPSASYLYNADVVITDYSSIIFDAFLLNKPVVLFEKTRGFIQKRGMYFSYPDDYTSFIARTENELIDLCRYRANHPYLTNTEQRCRDITADMCDGHSCERVCKLIIDTNK